MNILHIETSTHVCSIALSEAHHCLLQQVDYQGMNHAALLSLFIEKAFDLLKKEGKKLDAVAISAGPGSYTGLRIGASTAKGLCYGLDIPLLSISTLEIMMLAAQKQIQQPADSYLLVPMIDARRMEVYDAIFNQDGKLIRQPEATIIDETSYLTELQNNKIYFFGNGAEKCKSAITHPNAIFLEDVHPLAENMILPVLQKFENQVFEDVAYFEPFYLKEFQGTIGKKMWSC